MSANTKKAKERIGSESMMKRAFTRLWRRESPNGQLKEKTIVADH